ncbi:MAG: type II secretion system F family protein [Oligoflexia bacterium]|nr:type II secretion system F family protein [Oligoflexia bacterium]
MTKLLIIVSETRFNMHLGLSLKISLKKALENKTDDLSKTLKIWQLRLEAGQNFNEVTQSYPFLLDSAPKRAFISILKSGFNGSPTDTVLNDLELELERQIENDFEKYLQLLPIKLMLPLALLILPAVVLLLITPLIINLGDF